MKTYNMSNVADNKTFDDVCKLIENSNIELRLDKTLVDVDGSLLRIYSIGDKKIKVYNDYEVDAVYIDSEIDIIDIIGNI